jgi:CheY-like chemotaxis protein
MVHLHPDTRRVLLIDQNPFKQNLRATVLRNYEIEVHTAANARDAESLWISNLYDLILLAAPVDSEEAIALPDQIRKNKPRQRIALLVGAPHYIREVGGTPKRLPRAHPMPPDSFTTSLVETARPQWQMIEHIMSRPELG